MVPFSTSKIKTKAAGSLPPMRKTFVAPGLLEPVLRGSGRVNTRQIKTALDIEPNKYALQKRKMLSDVMYLCSVNEVQFTKITLKFNQ